MSIKIYQAILCLLFIGLGISQSHAQEIILNFEDVPALSDANLGTDEVVSISGTIPVVVPSNLPDGSIIPGGSGTQCIAVNSGESFVEFEINFNTPVDNPSIKATYPSPPNPSGPLPAPFEGSNFGDITVTAYDADGNVLGTKTVNATGLVFVNVNTTYIGVSRLAVSTTPGGTCFDDISYTLPEVNTCSEDFIADAGEDQTLYIGYRPLRTTTLEVDFSGGAGDETIEWSTGETTASIHICPEETTTYTVTVTDVNGCEAVDEVTIAVEDVRCGWYGNRVIMCYRGWNYCVSRWHVWWFHRYYGATIGRCNNGSRQVGNEKPEIDFSQADQYSKSVEGLDVKVFPNPATDQINIDPGIFLDTEVELSVFDIDGKLVVRRSFDNMGIERLDVSTMNAGIYHVRLKDNTGMTDTQRFVVLK